MRESVCGGGEGGSVCVCVFKERMSVYEKERQCVQEREAKKMKKEMSERESKISVTYRHQSHYFSVKYEVLVSEVPREEH